MKRNILYNIKRTSILLGSLAFIGLSMSCLDNIDPDKLTPEDLDKDYKWAAFIKSMQLSIIPLDQNQYQLSDDLHGNNYAGYIGEVQNWNGNSNSLTYFFSSGLHWHDEMFNVAYGNVNPNSAPGCMPSWNSIRQNVEPTSIILSVSNVLKIHQMQRTTDAYGPIPYFDYGKTATPEYDSQKDIYYSFFNELNDAINSLTNAYSQNSGAKPLGDNDAMFASNMLQWVKYANSLKLRLALRISYVDPVKAKQYAEEAVNHPLGVIEDNADNASLKGALGIANYRHPLNRITEVFKEPTMGADMDSYMNGYKDPRLPYYFTKSGLARDYFGVRTGISNPTSYPGKVSVPAVGYNDDLVLLSAAEVAFLRAEGAIKSWNMGGTAESFYNKGIELSMQYYGILPSDINTYINDNTSVPASYVDLVASNSNSALSTISIKWNNSATAEQKLERIMIQKWLAIYPDGTEAWADVRRTGYPKLFPITTNRSSSGSAGGVVISANRVKRLPLPYREYNTNKGVVDAAVNSYLEGVDAAATKLWWDAK